MISVKAGVNVIASLAPLKRMTLPPLCFVPPPTAITLPPPGIALPDPNAIGADLILSVLHKSKKALAAFRRNQSRIKKMNKL